MIFSFFALSLVVMATATASFDATWKVLPSSHEEHLAAFEHLVAKHGRSYTSVEERERKLATFKSNVAHMRELRARSEGRAQFSPNQFFDLSKTEFAAYRMKPHNVVEEAKRAAAAKPQAQQVVTACLASNVEKKRSAAVPLSPRAPTSFDWRNVKGVVTPVKNQAQCGSCWAFSATETLESAWAIAKNVTAPILAPQQIVDCSVSCSKEGNPPQVVCDQGCDGGWPWAAVATIIDAGGQDSEASYPYQGVDGTCAANPKNFLAVPRNYSCLSGPNLADDNEMINTLLKSGPLSIACDASEWQFYEFGIITQNFLCSQTELDHAIQITGYSTETDVFGYSIPVWHVRNSWGSAFGLEGYLYLSRGENTCGINAAVTSVIV